MTKNEDNIQDWRSTGRRKARRAMYEAYVPYMCVGIPELGIECGKTTIEPPKDAPKWFDEIWPEDNRVLTSQLQANHMTKDLTINDVSFVEWLCPSHHKLKDSQTMVGETTVQESYW